MQGMARSLCTNTAHRVVLSFLPFLLAATVGWAPSAVAQPTVTLTSDLVALGSITFGGFVVVVGDRTVEAGGDITFGFSVDADPAGGSLALTAGGVVVFGGPLGDANPLDSLTVDATEVFIDGDLTARIGPGGHDPMRVDGAVILGSAGFFPTAGPGFAPQSGDKFLIVDNDGTDAVTGTFFDLPEGSVVPVDSRILIITYQGGDGNDVALFAPLIVMIDIKPGSDRNSINPRSKGVIPVAILGSDTFDVADVDVTTLAFGPNGARLAHRKGPHPKDANHDGFTDLLAHFLTEEAGIEFGDPEACVTGETLDGTPISGCNTVEVLAPKGGKP